MSRPCSVCVHPEREAIDALLAERPEISRRSLAHRFGLSRAAMHRHARVHAAFLPDPWEWLGIARAVARELADRPALAREADDAMKDACGAALRGVLRWDPWRLGRLADAIAEVETKAERTGRRAS